MTHTLWSLQHQGFTVLFKGGTSLSKRYGVIERFSEDLDIKLESEDLPSVDLKRETKPTEETVPNSLTRSKNSCEELDVSVTAG